MKSISDPLLFTAPSGMFRALERLEARLGPTAFWAIAHLLFFSALYVLYGRTELYVHGEIYFRRSEDPFLQREETREFFRREVGLENLLLPLLGYLTRAGLVALGQEYTKAWFLAISTLPYLLFFIAMCLHFRPRLGFVGTGALFVALYSSGLIPYMLLFPGGPAGMSYLLLFLVYIAIDVSLPLTLVLVLASILTHFQGVITIMVLLASMCILRPSPRYIAALSATSVGLVAAALIWSAVLPGNVDRVSHNSTVFASLHDFLQHVADVYGVAPWNVLSPFKLLTLPLLLVGIALLRTKVSAGLAYFLPLACAALSLLSLGDVTRHLTFIAFPTFLFMVSTVAASSTPQAVARLGALLYASRISLLRDVFIACALLSLLTPNYYIADRDVETPTPYRILQVLDWLGNGRLQAILGVER